MSYLFSTERPQQASMRDSRGLLQAPPVYATAAQLKQWQQEQDDLAATSFLVPANGHHAETQRRRRVYESVMRANRAASNNLSSTSASSTLMTSSGVLPVNQQPETDFLVLASAPHADTVRRATYHRRRQSLNASFDSNSSDGGSLNNSLNDSFNSSASDDSFVESDFIAPYAGMSGAATHQLWQRRERAHTRKIMNKLPTLNNPGQASSLNSTMSTAELESLPELPVGYVSVTGFIAPSTGDHQAWQRRAVAHERQTLYNTIKAQQQQQQQTIPPVRIPSAKSKKEQQLKGQKDTQLPKI